MVFVGGCWLPECWSCLLPVPWCFVLVMANVRFAWWNPKIDGFPRSSPLNQPQLGILNILPISGNPRPLRPATFPFSAKYGGAVKLSHTPCFMGQLLANSLLCGLTWRELERSWRVATIPKPLPTSYGFHTFVYDMFIRTSIRGNLGIAETLFLPRPQMQKKNCTICSGTMEFRYPNSKADCTDPCEPMAILDPSGGHIATTNA